MSEKQIFSADRQPPKEMGRLKKLVTKATAVVALGAVGFGLYEGAKAMRDSESFTAWNDGPTLSVRANTLATVVGREHLTHDASYGKFSIPEGKYILEIREQATQKESGKKWDEDWVEVTESSYKHTKTGDKIEVEQLDPHWDNRLFAKEEYSVHELGEQNK